MNPFTEDYYMRGPQTGLSNYVNYSWVPELTRPFAAHLKAHWGCKPGETFLDFGCARGYVVRAMRELGLAGFGVDISDWAVENCDPVVSPFIRKIPQYPHFDYILAKDVLEHVPSAELATTIGELVGMTREALMIIVPLVRKPGDDYIRLEDRSDSTHVTRWTLEQWMLAVCTHAFGCGKIVRGSWSIPGLKPAAEQVFRSCGFIEVTAYPM